MIYWLDAVLGVYCTLDTGTKHLPDATLRVWFCRWSTPFNAWTRSRVFDKDDDEEDDDDEDEEDNDDDEEDEDDGLKKSCEGTRVVRWPKCEEMEVEGFCGTAGNGLAVANLVKIGVEALAPEE